MSDQASPEPRPVLAHDLTDEALLRRIEIDIETAVARPHLHDPLATLLRELAEIAAELLDADDDNAT
ncbi:MAG: hypothetical protein AAFR04_11680 [Pseudomonadota bacterium]